MKLLLDQGVPKRAAEILREEGVAAVHTSQIRILGRGEVGSGHQ